MKLIRRWLKILGNRNDCERSIQEFARLSGQGHSHGWRFDRDEIRQRATTAEEKQTP